MSMHIIYRHSVLRAAFVAALALPLAGMAGQQQLLSAQPGDLAGAATSAPGVAQKMLPSATPGSGREPVALSWAAAGPIADTAATPFLARSREYYTEVSGAELNAGVAIYTSSARALVRLQPLSSVGPREDAAIHPLALVLADSAGRAFDSGKGMEMLVSADKLARADMPFASGTSAFRIHPQLGAGRFTLKTSGVQDGDRYLINVVEPDSKVVLTMQTGASAYLHGQELVLTPELVEQAGSSADDAFAPVSARFHFSRLDGHVTSPAGRSFPVSFQPGKDGRLRARLTLDADEDLAPGLWEVQAQAEAVAHGQKVLRTVRLGFPVAMPVARLNGTALVQGAAGLDVGFGVEVAAAGRYEVRALLYGMVGGEMKPVGVAHSAAWLEAGQGNLTLRYAPELLAGAVGPFELRDLSLLDQSRVGLLQRQQRALVIDERDIVRGASRSGAGLIRQPVRVKLAPNAAG